MITKDLGKRIQELRKEKTGLSQEKFALKIEMDRTYFASVEAGRRNISIVNIKKIADGLGAELRHVLGAVVFAGHPADEVKDGFLHFG